MLLNNPSIEWSLFKTFLFLNPILNPLFYVFFIAHKMISYHLSYLHINNWLIYHQIHNKFYGIRYCRILDSIIISRFIQLIMISNWNIANTTIILVVSHIDFILVYVSLFESCMHKRIFTQNQLLNIFNNRLEITNPWLPFSLIILWFPTCLRS